MHSSLLIACIFAVAITAIPTPAPSCITHCCQSLQNPDNMSKLLGVLAIPRSAITGLMGIGCIAEACPSTIVGVASCCSGPTLAGIVTSGCAPLKW